MVHTGRERGAQKFHAHYMLKTRVIIVGPQGITCEQSIT